MDMNGILLGHEAVHEGWLRWHVVPLQSSVKLSTEPWKDFYFRCAGLNLSHSGRAGVSDVGRSG